MCWIYCVYNVFTSWGRLAQWLSVRFVKFVSRGPRFEYRRGFYFSVAIYSQKGLTAISNIRTCYIVSRNLSDKQLLQQSLLVKRNVALEIGPMTSHLREWNDVIYSTTQFYLIYNTMQATCDGISTNLTIRRRQCVSNFGLTAILKLVHTGLVFITSESR